MTHSATSNPANSGHANSEHAASDGASFAHPSSVRMLLITFFALVFLTFVTVLISAYAPLGEFELLVSMIIATIKGGLVCLFFMHMIHDKGFNIVVFFSAFLFVLMFVGITLLDTSEYQNEVRSFDREPATTPVVEPAKESETPAAESTKEAAPAH